MRFARVRFAVFVAVVLGAPAALMVAGDPRLPDLGKLVMLLSPAAAGLLLNGGFGRRKVQRWRWVAYAAAVTLVVALGALAVAFAAGAAHFDPSAAVGLDEVLARSAFSGATSVVEELGWSVGALDLAVAACGRRWGVEILGLVWAAWHLIPSLLHSGLFPQLEAAHPLMLAAFVVACLAYRELLTSLRERAGTWLAGAVGHAAPNMLLAALLASGLGGFERPGAGLFLPAPGGLVFPVLTLIALLLLARVPRELIEVPGRPAKSYE